MRKQLGSRVTVTVSAQLNDPASELNRLVSRDGTYANVLQQEKPMKNYAV